MTKGADQYAIWKPHGGAVQFRRRCLEVIPTLAGWLAECRASIALARHRQRVRDVSSRNGTLRAETRRNIRRRGSPAISCACAVSSGLLRDRRLFPGKTKIACQSLKALGRLEME